MTTARAACRRAAALAELAAVLPVLLLFSLATTEVGFAIRTYVICQSAAYRGVRSAAVGEPVETIVERAKSGVPAYIADHLEVTAEKRHFFFEIIPEPWQPLGDITVGSRTVNDAEPGEHVRVTVTYHHHLLTPIASFLVSQHDGTIPIVAIAVAEREAK